MLIPCKSKLVIACNRILPKPCVLQNLSQLQPAMEKWMGSLISISNTDCSKMYFSEMKSLGTSHPSVCMFSSHFIEREITSHLLNIAIWSFSGDMGSPHCLR